MAIAKMKFREFLPPFCYFRIPSAEVRTLGVGLRTPHPNAGPPASREGPNLLDRFFLENGDIPQIYPPEDPGAQRQSREEPRDRPGEILQKPQLLLFGGLRARGARWKRRYNETPGMALNLRS